MQVKVVEGETLNVEGPARVKVVEGEGDVFGFKASKGFEFVVKLYKQVSYHALTDSVLEVYGGKISSWKGEAYPKAWSEVAERISSEEKPLRIMVIGGVDTGKTTLVTVLANKLYSKGFKVAIIDADVGQSEIGPPTTIGLGLVSKPITSPYDTKLVDCFFLGSITPSRILQRALCGVSLMLNKALELKCNAIILDTTGWVDDPEGRELKILKMKVFKPTHIILISDAEEIDFYKRYAPNNVEVVSLPRGIVRARSREERRSIRQLAYRAWFINASLKSIHLGKVKVSYSFMFTGKPLTPKELDSLSKMLRCRVFYGEVTGRYLILVTERSIIVPDEVKTLYNRTGVRVITPDKLRHLLVALYGDEGFLGLGVVKDFDFKNMILKVYTPVNVESVREVHFGLVRLNPDTCVEEGFLDRWSF